MNIYVDSDVIISSLLSQKGASHFLLGRKIKRKVIFYISIYSKKELEKVVERLDIPKKELQKVLKKLKIIEIKKSIKEIKEEYGKYVVDEDDAHIVAGSVISKSEFLITYNLKDYKKEKIKRDFKIKIMTPGKLLQYLRSVK